MQCATASGPFARIVVQHRRCRAEQLARRHDAIHESDAKRFLRVDHLARQQQLQRAPLADEPRQSLRAAVAWNEPELHLRLAELRGVGRDANVTRHRQLASAAEREAVDRGDGRLGRCLEAAEDFLAALRERLRRDGAVSLELGDVGAGDERASGSGENDAADVRVARAPRRWRSRARRSRDR